MVLAQNLFLQNRFVTGFVSGSQTPTTSISYTPWLTGLGRSILAAIIAKNAVFSNSFAHLLRPRPFSRSETESPGIDPNP
jgi:hypothetical protein